MKILKYFALITAMVLTVILLPSKGQLKIDFSADQQCTFNDKMREELALLARGEMAGLRILDQPISAPGGFEHVFEDSWGDPLTLDYFTNRIVLLNLWATWCPPCRLEMPALDRLQGYYPEKDFTVLALNTDSTRTKQKGPEFYNEIGIAKLKYYHTAPTAPLLKELRAKKLFPGLPTSLLIDRNNCIIAAMAGPAEWDSPDAHALIEWAIAIEKYL